MYTLLLPPLHRGTGSDVITVVVAIGIIEAGILTLALFRMNASCVINKRLVLNMMTCS